MVRDAYGPAAHIQALLANIHRIEEKRAEPYTPADFMPGAEVKSEREELFEWAEKVLSGESFEEPDQEEQRRFRARWQEAFNTQ